jgi:arylformamidase
MTLVLVCHCEETKRPPQSHLGAFVRIYKKNYMKIIDISPALNRTMAVWPGDDHFVYQKIVSGNLTVGTLATSIHAGAHIDAPLHIEKNGDPLDDLPLHLFIGECQVLDVTRSKSKTITMDTIREDVKAPRLLFKTASFDYSKPFETGFHAFSPGLIDHLAKQDILLLGIDTPSVDLYNDSALPVHHRMLYHQMAILEGLQLVEVKAGIYTLIALPLKISGSDGSPTRAVLIRNSPDKKL